MKPTPVSIIVRFKNCAGELCKYKAKKIIRLLLAVFFFMLMGIFSAKTRKNHQKFFVVFRKCHILGAEIEGQR
jgi:hypothetical protein